MDKTETSAATLVDILSEAISSTIAADNSATEEYFEKLKEYAVSENGEELETLDCKVRGENDGEYYTLKVPKLILMPMPLLHVQEATFDVEGEWEVQENSSDQISKEEVEASLNKIISSKSGVKDAMVQVEGLEQLSKTMKLSNLELKSLINESTLPPSLKKVVAKKIPSTRITLAGKVKPLVQSSSQTNTQSNTESSNSNSQSLKIKVAIKLQQSEVPSGLSNLIQTVTNCIKVEKSVK